LKAVEAAVQPAVIGICHDPAQLGMRSPTLKWNSLTRLRGFAYGKVDFPMGAWCQGFDFP